MNKHRCFADEGFRCKALTDKICEYGGCHFYKTEQKLYDERQAVEEYINKKYGVSQREFVERKYEYEIRGGRK